MTMGQPPGFPALSGGGPHTPKIASAMARHGLVFRRRLWVGVSNTGRPAERQ